MSIASLILGIFGPSGWVIGIGIFLGFLLATPGLVFGILSIVRSQPRRGMAITGIILSCLGLAGAVVNLAFNIEFLQHI